MQKGHSRVYIPNVDLSYGTVATKESICNASSSCSSEKWLKLVGAKDILYARGYN